MSWGIRLSIAVLSLAALNAAASAATVDLAFTYVDPSQIETVSFNGGATYNQFYTGQYNFNVSNNGVPEIIPGSTLSAWCIEAAEEVSGSPNTYTVLGPGLGAYVSPPFGNISAVNAFFNQYYSTSFTANEKTAFQLSIWELEFDSTPGSLASGTFQAQSDPAVSQAETWLAGFNSTTAGPWLLYQLHSDTLQDQIIVIPGGGSGNSAPLPAALPGGLGLLALLGGYRAWRLKRASA